jgi:hypothetical protein
MRTYVLRVWEVLIRSIYRLSVYARRNEGVDKMTIHVCIRRDLNRAKGPEKILDFRYRLLRRISSANIGGTAHGVPRVQERAEPVSWLMNNEGIMFKLEGVLNPLQHGHQISNPASFQTYY